MASPRNDHYGVVSGGSISAGRSSIRPYLVALGHSMIARSELDISWPWVGSNNEAPHKWANAFLGMPFDYLYCDIDNLVMNPVGAYLNDMINGFYGQSGNTSSGIMAVQPTFIAQIGALAGSRPVVAALMCVENDLTGGIPAATVWSHYNSLLDAFYAMGWKTIISTSVPTNSYNTTTERDNVTALSALMNAALPDARIVRVLDWTSPYQNMAEPSGYQQPLAGYTLDGIHLAKKGAFTLGLEAGVKMAGLYPSWRPAATDVVCSINPTLSGTGGTLGSGASGVVPTGFTLQAPGTGCSVVGSVGDGYYEMVFTYSGAAYPSGTIQGLIAGAGIQNCTPGTTVIQTICDVEIIACTNYIWQARTQYDVSNVGQIPSITATDPDPWMDVAAGYRLALHTEPFLCPVAATRLAVSFGARPVYGCTSATLTVRLVWMGTKQA